MLPVYTKYLETQLHIVEDSVERRRKRQASYTPPPPKQRGWFETFLYGKKDAERTAKIERDKQALRDEWNKTMTEGSEETIAEIREELQQLSSANTWTQHDVEIRIRKLDHLKEAREKVMGYKDQLKGQAGGFLGAILDIGAEIVVDKGGVGPLLDDAIWELEQFKKSRPLNRWGEKPQDEADTIKERLKKHSKSIDELWQAEEELFKEYSQKYGEKKARELVDEAMRRFRQERRV
jgi:hypothetical protein